MKFNFFTLICSFALILNACKKEESSTAPIVPAYLIFKFKFDSTQTRQDNLGRNSTIPAGNAAFSPIFNKMSAHYIELAPTNTTLLGSGFVAYRAEEVTTGGKNAIDFSKAHLAGDGEIFFAMPISEVTPGTYQHLRVSLAYQNYDIRFKSGAITGMGTIASFVGFNTYISNFTVKNQSVSVNANKLQGFWAFETTVLGSTYSAQGQAPPGATTVPNPLAFTSPIPAGSCVVTGTFAAPLEITGKETNHKTIIVSISTNKSFEWKDVKADGWYEPAAGDEVVDMGTRGLIPFVE